MDKRQKLGVATIIVDAVVSIGVGSLTGCALKMITPANAGKFTKFCMGAARFVLTSMAIDKTTEYTVDTATKYIDMIAPKSEQEVQETEEQPKEELDS